MHPTAYLTHPLCLAHDTGPNHPERPERLRAIRQALARRGLDAHLLFLEAPAADRALLAQVHDPAYLDALAASVPTRGRVWLDTDTPVSPASWDAALRGAGAVATAVDGVLDGAYRRAFCAVRPPGHHAERARAMGFCLLNNIAVGAARALARGLERVAILDFDVHHGNGTEDIVTGDPRILYCSTFQHPWYPYSGTGRHAANILPVPLPAGTGGAAYRHAVEEHWGPALEAFRPQLILVSAGFDVHRADPLAGLNLETTDFRWLGEWIGAHADAHGEGRVVAALEGGYDLHALGESASAYIAALAGV